MNENSSESPLRLTWSRHAGFQSAEVCSPPDANTAIKFNNDIKEKTS